MFKLKFSKNSIASIAFLLAAIFISLLLGSFQFLRVDSVAALPHLMENLDNMDSDAAAASPTAAPSAMPTFTTTPKPPAAAAPVSISTQEDLAKALNINDGDELKHLMK